MAKSIQLAVKARALTGSRANKRLRDTGEVPGVIYGHKEAVVPVAINRKEITNHLNKGAHIFELGHDGKNETVLVKDVQFDHLGMEVIHVDFTRVSLDERVKITVPIELKGEPKGAADGGVLTQVLGELDIECRVLEIPELIRHNVAELGLNEVLHVRDLKLPEGVKSLQDGEVIVATVKEVLDAAPAVAAVEAGAGEPEIIGRKAAEDAAAAAAAEAEKK